MRPICWVTYHPRFCWSGWLNVQPLRLIISCRSVAGGRGHDSRSNESFVDGVPPGAIGLLNSAGALLANIDKMPLMLKSLVLDNCFAPPDVLISAMGAQCQLDPSHQ